MKDTVCSQCHQRMTKAFFHSDDHHCMHVANNMTQRQLLDKLFEEDRITRAQYIAYLEKCDD